MWQSSVSKFASKQFSLKGPQSNISAPSILEIRTCEAFNPTLPQKRDKWRMKMK